jgi:hypothetical protein
MSNQLKDEVSQKLASIEEKFVSLIKSTKDTMSQEVREATRSAVEKVALRGAEAPAIATPLRNSAIIKYRH